MEDRSEDDNGAVPVCANQTDDDGDGLTDFPADPGCLSAQRKVKRDICGDSVRISNIQAMPTEILGSTGNAEASNALDSADLTCGTRSNVERIWLYRNPYTADLTIRTDYAETEIATALYVRSNCGLANSELGCDTESGNIPGRSRLFLEDVPAGDYFIVRRYRRGGRCIQAWRR